MQLCRTIFKGILLGLFIWGGAACASKDDSSSLNSYTDSGSEKTDSQKDSSVAGTDSDTIGKSDSETASAIKNETDAATDSPTDTGTGIGAGTKACPLPDDKYLSVEATHDLFISECSNLVFLNVVDETFYNLGHISGSIEITWDSLAKRLDEVNKERTIIIYCRRGVRSESAYDTLVNAGYSSLFVMKDGIEAWIAAGYDVVPIP